eukprot:2977820-Pleurochrysis_carterae.AAC.2
MRGGRVDLSCVKPGWALVAVSGPLPSSCLQFLLLRLPTSEADCSRLMCCFSGGVFFVEAMRAADFRARGFQCLRDLQLGGSVRDVQEIKAFGGNIRLIDNRVFVLRAGRIRNDELGKDEQDVGRIAPCGQ